MGNLAIELRYAFRERAVVAALVISLLITAWATITGKLDVDKQRATTQALVEETVIDQRQVLPLQQDPGSAAYYVFHMTYQPPSNLAFSAFGTRDDLPWQHRLRMLALEGQIYEADTGNPELSRLGRLDFAFFASVLLPLVLILLLYDLDARERREGRYELLNATSTSGRNTLLVKAGARTLLLFAFATLPFVAMALISSASPAKLLGVVLVVGLHLVFWLAICRLVTTRVTEAPTAATLLVALWLLFTTAVPAASRVAVESLVPVPAGGEILLAQREAVNDAWDLPKAATMDPFLASHPEWEAYAEIKESFEWKWYYAFQQMGDEIVQAESNALRDGIARRHELMGLAAILSPPLATERWLTHLAGTDRAHHQQYVSCAREFHQTLRKFHYPLLFEKVEFTPEAMAQLPSFRYCNA